MQLLRAWALPLVAILAILVFSALTGSITLGLPILLSLVWLGYALIKTRSRVGIAVTGEIQE